MFPRNKLLIVLPAIALIAGLAYSTYWFMSRGRDPIPPGDSGGLACTEEALQCPDGSYVARTGAQCAFAACPNQPSFMGTLRQDANGFTLITGSPENGGDVAYAMPLTLKVSNVVGQLVGQKVRVYGSFTEGATLAVERLEALPGDAGDPTLGEVGVGKSMFINGVRVTLNKIVQDSRCPIDVQCIQAGWVTANVTLQSDTDKETVDIASNAAAPHAFDAYQISIANVAPSRIAGAATDPTRYLVTFRVRAN